MSSTQVLQTLGFGWEGVCEDDLGASSVLSVEEEDAGPASLFPDT